MQDWICRVAVHQARVLGKDPSGRSPGQGLRKALCARGEGKRVREVQIRKASAARTGEISGFHREGLRACSRSAALRRGLGPSALPFPCRPLPPPPLPLRRRRPTSPPESLQAAGWEPAPTPIAAQRRPLAASSQTGARSRTARSPALTRATERNPRSSPLGSGTLLRGSTRNILLSCLGDIGGGI